MKGTLTPDPMYTLHIFFGQGHCIVRAYTDTFRPNGSTSRYFIQAGTRQFQDPGPPTRRGPMHRLIYLIHLSVVSLLQPTTDLSNTVLGPLPPEVLARRLSTTLGHGLVSDSTPLPLHPSNAHVV
jgi:hypothetical protein